MMWSLDGNTETREGTVKKGKSCRRVFGGKSLRKMAEQPFHRGENAFRHHVFKGKKDVCLRGTTLGETPPSLLGGKNICWESS